MEENNWKNCLEEIKKNISAQAYETWFSAVRVIAINGDNCPRSANSSPAIKNAQ